MPRRYIVKYTKTKHQDTIRVGTLWYYRDLIGSQSDHHDGLLALKDGDPIIPASGVDYVSYLDIANCYLVCLTVQDDLQPVPSLLERFGAEMLLPCGLVDGDVENRAQPSPVTHGADGTIPFYAVPSNDPDVDRSGEYFMSVQLGDSLAQSFCQEIYREMERSNGLPVKESQREDRYTVKYDCRYVTYLAPETRLQFPDDNPEHLATAIAFTKEESFRIEEEYRIMMRLFDKKLNRYVSVNYEPIDIPIDAIQNPTAKFFRA